MSAFGYFFLAGNLRPFPWVMGIEEQLTASAWKGPNESTSVGNGKEETGWQSIWVELQ